MKYYFYLILLLIIAETASAQDVSSKASLDTNNLLIGERITLKFEILSKPDYLVVWPEILDTIGKIEILKRSKIDTLASKGLISYSQSIELTAFDEGNFQIPPFTFVYEKKGSGNLLTSLTEPLYVNFSTVAIDTNTSIKDIKAPLEFPVTLSEILPYILYGLGAIGLGILIYFAIKRIKREPKRKIKRYDATMPADLEAIEALNHLEKEKLWQKSFYKEYYTRLTDIIRTYIHRRYTINSFEMTSIEIIEALSQKDVPELAFTALASIFNTSDVAKFAKYEPIASENSAAMENSYLFVKTTKEMIELPETTNSQEIQE